MSLELFEQADDHLHPVACIVCGITEKHWVDVRICGTCIKSGRAAVEFETLKRTNAVLEKIVAELWAKTEAEG